MTLVKCWKQIDNVIYSNETFFLNPNSFIDCLKIETVNSVDISVPISYINVKVFLSFQ